MRKDKKYRLWPASSMYDEMWAIQRKVLWIWWTVNLYYHRPEAEEALAVMIKEKNGL